MEIIVLPALNGAVLALAVNGFFTLAVQYVPVVRVWFGGLVGGAKETFFLLLTLAVGAGYFALGLVDPAILASAGLAVPPVTVVGFILAVGGALASLPVGKGIYDAIPETADVAAAKLNRPS